MSDKRTTLDEAVASIESGMTIGIGGWGSRRKPMAFVRALLRTDVKDLTVVSYGGPDVGLLCAAGKLKRLYYGFVSLDSPPFYDPWFAKARTTGAIEARQNMGRIAAEQVLETLDGKRPPRIINPEVWPVYAERFKQAFGMTPG